MKIPRSPLLPRSARLLVAAAALLVPLAGCDAEIEPLEAAPLGATPPVEIPLGPVPGTVKLTGDELPSNPYAGDRIALMQGRKLFVWYNCAGCHGGRGGGGMGPSLRDVTWIYGGSEAHIFLSIAEGRAHGMPAWGTKLPEDHIWKLVAYIDSMGTELEPVPPDAEQPKVTIPDSMWPGGEGP